MPFINSANAVELGIKSGEVRRQRKELSRFPSLTVVPIDEYQPKALKRVRAQLESLDDALSVCIEAADWDSLTRAKERLFKQWVYLAGIPGPGNRRPGPATRERKPAVEPVDPPQ